MSQNVEQVFTSVVREGGVWTVTMNRADVRNALNAAAHRELASTFAAFDSADDASVAILTGAGSIFCVGHDDDALRGLADEPLPEGGFGGLTRRPYNRKPIIAAVNGDAFDEGFELALACDVVVANEDARFALRQGLSGRAPLEGGIHRLMRQIPQKRALAAALTGATISASEGVLLGFVNDITGFDQVLPLARDWAARIRRLPHQAVLAIQQLAMQGAAEPSVAAALRAEYSEAGKLLGSAEYARSTARASKDQEE